MKKRTEIKTEKRSEKKKEQGKKGAEKTFLRRFIIYLAVFTIVLTPVNAALSKIAKTRVFSGSMNIMDEMDYMIDPDSPFYEEFKKQDRVNILMLGLNDGLSDVMMLGSYDLKNQRVDVISVPRDTYFYRSGYSGAAFMKINSIYHTEGIVSTAEAVSEVLLGIPVNYYVIVDYDAVRAVVDEMGGVPLDIPFTMKYDDPYDTPPLHIYFEQGHHVLDGDDAVSFLRYRKGYAQGDIGRIGAHQEFIKSAFRQTLKHGPVSVAKVAFEKIESDIPLGMLLKLAGKAAGLDGDAIYTWTVPGGSGTSSGASYWYADTEQTEDMLDRIYNFKDYIEEDGEENEDAEDTE